MKFNGECDEEETSNRIQSGGFCEKESAILGLDILEKNKKRLDLKMKNSFATRNKLVIFRP